MPTTELVQGPTLNAALLHVVAPSGALGPKASGTLLRVDDELYLLTNWHVATGRRWKTPEERAEWREANGDATHWMSNSQAWCNTPRALRISIYAMGQQRVLTQIEIEDDISPTDPRPRFAWESPDQIMHSGLVMPPSDVVCLHVTSRAQELAGRLSVIAGRRTRVGYDYWESGLDHGSAVGDRVFVVGYPRDIGRHVTDPPVWTGGSISTDPATGWEGQRFLIDARTREGQSGSAVIAFSPSAGGLPAQHQLLGLYSGRIDDKADIGSVWALDDILEELATRRRRPRRAIYSADIEVEPLLKVVE